LSEDFKNPNCAKRLQEGTSMNIAINGFGRIGRMVFRCMIDQKDMNIVAINDLTDTKTLAHLLKYDSVHGRLKQSVSHDAENIIVDGKKIRVYAQRDPSLLPWKDLKVDVVVESTGFFTKREGAAKHLQAGAKKVLISGPSEDADKVIVIGVNEHEYDAQKHIIVSNASCTTNCLAPLVKILQDNYGVKRGFMTTVHSYTGDQCLVDGPHKDLRRARSAAVNLVPTSTGAAQAVAQVIPALKGKLDGIAIRAPTPDGSVTDFVCELEKEATAEQINALVKSVAEHHMKGVLEYTEDPIVSSDIVGNPHSSIFDAKLTKTMGNMVKVVSWYDNEWGYSNRMIDVIRIMGK
jgi:glyceraldehyde 3-phosphate dehydrogenase